MLDSRAPPGERYEEREAQAEKQIEEEARRLMAETRLWRLANSAMWTAWGIVQAHIPGMPDFEANDLTPTNEKSETAAMLESATAELRAEGGTEANGIVSQELAEEKDENKDVVEQEADLFKPQDEEEFDYLSYANDRALFLWGDMIRLGLVKAEDLPTELRERVKIVEY